MAGKIDDGGAAFPGYTLVKNGAHPATRIINPGMTLRDWFATHASEQDIESHRVTKRNVAGQPLEAPSSREVARYRHADAMIAARKEKPHA